MTEAQTDIPKGYWKDARGSLVPVTKIKDIDKDRTHCVANLAKEAKAVSHMLLAFKLTAMNAVNAFIERSLAEYEVAHGGKKGNVTLITFDGRYKITRTMQDAVVFDERLQAAKALIDECAKTWSKGSNDNIKVLINHAFQVDKAGTVNTGRILNLRTLKIEDDTWKRAMQAIADSMTVASTKAYIRFYELDAASGEYTPISLDVANL